MRVNNTLPPNNVNFTSTVSIIDTKIGRRALDSIVNSEDLLKGINVLEKNGNDDFVTLLPIEDSEPANILLEVTKKIGDKIYQGNKTISLFWHTFTGKDIPKAYDEALGALKLVERKPSPLDKYRINGGI